MIDRATRTAQVVELRRQGLTNNEVAARLGITTSAASGLFSGAARFQPELQPLLRRQFKLSAEQIEAIADYRERGWSYSRIAAKFGVSTGAVHYHCLRQGAVTPRSPGPAKQRGPMLFVARDGRTQRRFTPREDAELVRLSNEGIPAHRIADMVDRARTSVRVRLLTLALHEEMEAA